MPYLYARADHAIAEAVALKYERALLHVSALLTRAQCRETLEDSQAERAARQFHPPRRSAPDALAPNAPLGDGFLATFDGPAPTGLLQQGSGPA